MVETKRCTVLVIGGGSIGERHVRCFQKTKRADVLLCEINDEVRHRVTQQYSLRQSFQQIDSAIAEHPDAAVICTPAHLHIPLACQLAQEGIHLLIEKPLSISLDGIKQLDALVQSASLCVAVAYVYRSHPALSAMRQAVHSGQLGAAVQVTASAGQHFPFYRPAYRDIYYTSRACGGGAIQDALPHLIDAAQWLVGPVTRVAADAEHCVLEGVDVEDTVHALTRHGSVLGSFTLNQHQPPNESSITVICENGATRFEMHRHRWLSARKPGEDWKVEAEYMLERDDLFVRQANAFLNSLATATPPSCSFTEAVQTLKVSLAILESVQSNQWVTIT